MKYISNFLRSFLIITLFPCIVFGVAGSEKTNLVEQTIKSIKDCMAHSPAQWPDEWNKEYIETIRKVIELNQDASHFDLRLEILRKGFVHRYRQGYGTRNLLLRPD